MTGFHDARLGFQAELHLHPAQATQYAVSLPGNKLVFDVLLFEDGISHRNCVIDVILIPNIPYNIQINNKFE